MYTWMWIGKRGIKECHSPANDTVNEVVAYVDARQKQKIKHRRVGIKDGGAL